MCVDGTYKIIWQKHTLIVGGTTDFNNRFHPIGLMTTRKEKTKDYQFFFESLMKAVYEILLVNYSPYSLIADAASSISKGFMKAFSIKSYEVFNRVICWAHVIRNVDKNLAKVTHKQQRVLIRNDIVKLQTCQNASLF